MEQITFKNNYEFYIQAVIFNGVVDYYLIIQQVDMLLMMINEKSRNITANWSGAIFSTSFTIRLTRKYKWALCDIPVISGSCNSSTISSFAVIPTINHRVLILE